MQVTLNATLSAGKKIGSYVQLRVVDTPNEMSDVSGLPSVPFRDLPILGAFCLEKGSNTYVKTGGRSYINPEQDKAEVQRAKKSMKVLPLDTELLVGDVSDYVAISGKMDLKPYQQEALKSVGGLCAKTSETEAPAPVVAEGAATSAAVVAVQTASPAITAPAAPAAPAVEPINPTKWPFPNSQEAGVTLRPPVAPRANKKTPAVKKAAAPAKKAAVKKAPAKKKPAGKAAGKSK